MAVPLLIALKTIAEIGAAVQAVNGAYNFFEDKVKDVDKSQIILETVRRQMAQYQAEMEEQARIMKERKAFLEAEGRDTSSVAYVNAKLIMIMPETNILLQKRSWPNSEIRKLLC